MVFPIEDPEIRTRIVKDVLLIELRDNADARELQTDGSYQPPKRAEGEELFSAQKYFMAAASVRAAAAATATTLAVSAPAGT